MTDHATLRTLAEAATPGPWHADEGFGGVWVVTGGRADFATHPHSRSQEYAVLAAGDYPSAYKDADLIVAMRNGIEALLDELETLREALLGMLRTHGDPCSLLDDCPAITKATAALAGSGR